MIRSIYCLITGWCVFITWSCNPATNKNKNKADNEQPNMPATVVASTGATLERQLLAASPADQAGMLARRLVYIDTLMQQHIDKQAIPGAVCLIARKGKIVYHKAFGFRDVASQKPMEKNDIFRIMSMTKAITSVAVMMLYEEGRFLLDDPVSDFIPEFKNPKVLKRLIVNRRDTSFVAVPAKKEITIRHLLTHTAGIPYLHPLQLKARIPQFHSTQPLTLAQTIPQLAQLPLLHEPGEQFTYGLSTDVLGYLVEKASGMSLADFFNQRIFKPLGMEDTFFYVPQEKQHRLVTLYEEGKDGKIIPHTRPADYADYATKGAQTYYSGGAGLCSTVADYAKFMQMLLNGGRYNGAQILSRKTIELMTRNQIGQLTTWRGTKFGLGFELSDAYQASLLPGSEEMYRWGGMYFTEYWIDPKEELIALLFTQVWPSKHQFISKRFQALTYQAIVD